MHTNLSWYKAILANTFPQHAAVGCPKVPWFAPTYGRQTQILCSAKWMFHFPTLRFLVSQSRPGPLEDWEIMGFSFLLPTMEAFCWFRYFEAGCSVNNLFWTGLPPPIWFCPGFAQQANGSSLRDNAILWLVAYIHWQQSKPVCFICLMGLLCGNFQTKGQILVVFAPLAFLAVAQAVVALFWAPKVVATLLRFCRRTFVFVLMWTNEVPSLYVCIQKKCQCLIGHLRRACTATMRKFCWKKWIHFDSRHTTVLMKAMLLPWLQWIYPRCWIGFFTHCL